MLSFFPIRVLTEVASLLWLAGWKSVGLLGADADVDERCCVVCLLLLACRPHDRGRWQALQPAVSGQGAGCKAWGTETACGHLPAAKVQQFAAG